MPEPKADAAELVEQLYREFYGLSQKSNEEIKAFYGLEYIKMVRDRLEKAVPKSFADQVRRRFATDSKLPEGIPKGTVQDAPHSPGRVRSRRREDDS